MCRMIPPSDKKKNLNKIYITDAVTDKIPVQ